MVEAVVFHYLLLHRQTAATSTSIDSHAPSPSLSPSKAPVVSYYSPLWTLILFLEATFSPSSITEQRGRGLVSSFVMRMGRGHWQFPWQLCSLPLPSLPPLEIKAVVTLHYPSLSVQSVATAISLSSRTPTPPLSSSKASVTLCCHPCKG